MLNLKEQIKYNILSLDFYKIKRNWHCFFDIAATTWKVTRRISPFLNWANNQLTTSPFVARTTKGGNPFVIVLAKITITLEFPTYFRSAGDTNLNTEAPTQSGSQKLCDDKRGHHSGRRRRQILEAENAPANSAASLSCDCISQPIVGKSEEGGGGANIEAINKISDHSDDMPGKGTFPPQSVISGGRSLVWLGSMCVKRQHVLSCPGAMCRCALHRLTEKMSMVCGWRLCDWFDWFWVLILFDKGLEIVCTNSISK